MVKMAGVACPGSQPSKDMRLRARWVRVRHPVNIADRSMGQNVFQKEVKDLRRND